MLLRKFSKSASLVSFLVLASGANAHQQSTKDIWQHHIEAWESKDLNGIVSDYTENSVLILNNKIYRGKSEIGKIFERLFEIFEKGTNQIQPAIIEGRVVYITWHFSPESQNTAYFGTDTFLIEDSKIAVQTIASPLYHQPESEIR